MAHTSIQAILFASCLILICSGALSIQLLSDAQTRKCSVERSELVEMTNGSYRVQSIMYCIQDNIVVEHNHDYTFHNREHAEFFSKYFKTGTVCIKNEQGLRKVKYGYCTREDHVPTGTSLHIFQISITLATMALIAGLVFHLAEEKLANSWENFKVDLARYCDRKIYELCKQFSQASQGPSTQPVAECPDSPSDSKN